MHKSSSILEGNLVRLEALETIHITSLYDIGQDPAIWVYMPQNIALTVETMRTWVLAAIAERNTGRALPFAIVEKATQRVVGTTRFMQIKPRDRSLEIGWTWLASWAQRTGVNTESKYLLLQHAFENLGYIRIQFKTDSRNFASQKAIERIGAVKEGVLRKHMIMPDGYSRDSVYYSIVDEDWPGVKVHLLKLMQR